MKRAFFDTETTGIPLYKERSNDPKQPHLVQLACVIYDEEKQETESVLDVIIKPDGWVIPQETTDIHGITQEQAMDEGVPEAEVLEQFLHMIGDSPRVAHNESFDARLIRIAIKRYMTDELADIWKEGQRECTARLATKIVNLPPTAKMIAKNMNFPKTPTLAEAYEYFFAVEFKDMHSALADAMACKEVYYAIKNLS